MQTPWADRLFQRLAAIYGHQKLATMFAADSGEVRATWEEQLRRFKPDVLRRASRPAHQPCRLHRPQTLLALPSRSARSPAHSADPLTLTGSHGREFRAQSTPCDCCCAVPSTTSACATSCASILRMTALGAKLRSLPPR